MVLREWDWLRDEVAPRGVAISAVVVADDENLDIARQYGFETVECPNDTKGRKWNEGFRFAAAAGADSFCVIGSDDWIHPDVFATDPPGWAVSAAAQIDFVDLERGVLQRASHEKGFVPWLIPRAMLELTDFTPLPDRMQAGLETVLRGGLGHPSFVYRSGVPAVDFKTAESMSPYAGVRNSTGDGVEHDMTAVLSATYPAHLVEAARLVQEETA